MDIIAHLMDGFLVAFEPLNLLLVVFNLIPLPPLDAPADRRPPGPDQRNAGDCGRRQGEVKDNAQWRLAA